MLLSRVFGGANFIYIQFDSLANWVGARGRQKIFGKFGPLIFGGDAKHVIQDQDLPITIGSCADPYHRNGQQLAEFLAKLSGHAFHHKHVGSCLLKAVRGRMRRFNNKSDTPIDGGQLREKFTLAHPQQCLPRLWNLFPWLDILHTCGLFVAGDPREHKQEHRTHTIVSRCELIQTPLPTWPCERDPPSWSEPPSSWPVRSCNSLGMAYRVFEKLLNFLGRPVEHDIPCHRHSQGLCSHVPSRNCPRSPRREGYRPLTFPLPSQNYRPSEDDEWRGDLRIN